MTIHILNHNAVSETAAMRQDREALQAEHEWSEKVRQADAARLAKLAEAVADGFVDGDMQFSTAPNSLANWQSLATTLRAEIAEGETDAGDTVDIFDAAGVKVQSTAADVLALVAKIGKAARLMHTRDLQWRGQIEAATTESELDAIIADIEGA